MKKDISIIALVFFITRCFFNLCTYFNIYSFLIHVFIIFICLLFLKRFSFQFFQTAFFKWIYVTTLFMIFIIILINATKFININYFRYSNYFTTILSLLTISYIIGKDQIKTIASISEIFLWIFLLFTCLISIGLISLIDIHHYHGFIQLQNTTIKVFPLLMIIVLLYIRNNNMITGYLLGSISSFIDLILLVGCLGTQLPQTYNYPGISILKTITFFRFINHLDKLFSFIYLFEYTITLAFIINIIIHLIKKESV